MGKNILGGIGRPSGTGAQEMPAVEGGEVLMTDQNQELELGRAAEAVGKLYFFLFSDAYRELREAEVRWECYSAAQYHFDDGVKFILEGSGERYQVDHPVWSLYSEKIAEIAARVARAEDRKNERLAALKGIHAGFLRFCEDHGIDPRVVAEMQPFGQDEVAVLDKAHDVAPSGEVADQTCQTLNDEWDRSFRSAAGRRAA